MSRKVRNFFPEFNIRLYDKNSESDFFFLLHQNQNIFFSNIGNQNIFLEKTITPPPPSFKLNGRSLNCFIFSDYDSLRDVRKKNDRMVNIDKKNEINSLHVYSCYDFICKELFLCGFRKINTNLLYTLTILIICKENKN